MRELSAKIFEYFLFLVTGVLSDDTILKQF